MVRAVSPSDGKITKRQAGKFAALIMAVLGKSGLPRLEIQQVLEGQGPELAKQFLALVQAQVDQISKFVQRTVPVDRTLSPEAAIAATRRKQDVSSTVVSSMPPGIGDTADLTFIPLEEWKDNETIDQLLAKNGLVDADPAALAALNAAEPEFADKHPNFTRWKNAEEQRCYAAFDVWSGERLVDVDVDGGGWSGGWWVAGVRKPS